jgi:ELWxxDGT repeat protein
MIRWYSARPATARRAGSRRRRVSNPPRTVEALESRRLLTASFIADVTPAGADNFIANPTVVGGTTAFFIQDSTTQGARLWKSDGTAAGTVMLKDPYPANTNNQITGLTPLDGKLFFFTRDETGPGLWKSDGTAAGTVLVKRLPTDSSLAFVLGFRLYFFVTDAGQRTHLWRSDGTAAGTGPVWDAPPDARAGLTAAASPDGRTALFTLTGTNDFFRAPLWVTDGTADGTRVAVSPPDGTANWRPRGVVYAGGRAFFTIDDRGTLWGARADGSGAAPVTPADGQPITGARDLKPFGNRVLFAGLVGNQGWVMASDGTPAGTVGLASPPGGYGPTFPVTDKTAYFFVGGQLNAANRGIWVTDGTVAGTRRAVDVIGSGQFTLGGRVYFGRTTDSTGSELWESDGTAQGTRIVQDIVLGSPGSYPTLRDPRRPRDPQGDPCRRA